MTDKTLEELKAELIPRWMRIAGSDKEYVCYFKTEADALIAFLEARVKELEAMLTGEDNGTGVIVNALRQWPPELRIAVARKISPEADTLTAENQKLREAIEHATVSLRSLREQHIELRGQDHECNECNWCNAFEELQDALEVKK